MSNSTFDRHLKSRLTNNLGQNATICDLICEQANAQPSNIAMIDGDTQITYQQFLEKAQAVAHTLHHRGVKQGALVGVCMNRTWELIATLLGVMQAGCAYVPLDPKYPQQRIRYMLEHSRAAAVVVDNHSSAALCEQLSEQIFINQLIDNSEQAEHIALNSPTADDLAYVIYTSGSTGNPKGVAVEHGSIISFIKTLDELFNQQELSAMLATSSVCFDSSITETLGTLSLGGKVILAQNGLALTEPALADKVKSCVMIPSVLQTILSGNELPQSLECLIVGGEALKRPLVEQLYQLKPDLRLINVYGPTEDTVFSTTKEIKPGTEKITIGHSVSGSRAYILDDNLQTVGAGVAGELYLSGDKLAKGYLYDEQRTKERFIELELNAVGKVRLYKTGDICQWTEDGEIEFLGRADEQVKIRGFRIELSEIESVVESMPEVSAAAAVTQETAQGQNILVVFVVYHNEAIEQASVKAYLAQHLPHYMVPQVIACVEHLPYMPNGKLDRKQLQNQALPHQTSQNTAQKRNSGERLERSLILSMLQQEVASLLNMPDASQVASDFALDGFDLDSLSRVELRNRISKTIGHKLPTQAIYEYSTIAELSDYIDALVAGSLQTQASKTSKKKAVDSLGNFQALIQSSHPTFQAAKAKAWSASDKSKLVRQTVNLVNDERRNPFGKIIRTGSSARGTVVDPYHSEQHEAIIWTTNLYFGLNRDKDVIAQATDALHTYGTGMGISAAATGMLDHHYEFEQAYAKLVGKQAACLFPTGYTANLGGIAGLLGEDDVVIIDSLCHASIVDGANLSGARVRTFQHNNPSDLESVLKSEASPYHTVLVVIEGVYSMGEGTAPVADIVRMVKKYDALILVDEAHSFGFYGERGAGICAEQGVTEQVDFIMTTLSKALGSIGGVIAASDEHIELLKSSSRAYIFQASISPADIAAALASLYRLSADESLREQLWDRANYMREQFSKAGFDLGTGDGPIVTPHFADKDKLYAIVQGMSKRGVQTSAVTYPIVEKGRGRLRFICSAAHTKAEIDKTLQALIEAEQEADAMLANKVETQTKAPSMPITHIANWANEFALFLQAYLQKSSSLIPDLAIKLSIAGNESNIQLIVNDGNVVVYDEDQSSNHSESANIATKPDKDFSDLYSFSMRFNDDHTVNALCTTDIQALLSGILKDGCQLNGMVEGFIWFFARFTEYKVSH